MIKVSSVNLALPCVLRASGSAKVALGSVKVAPSSVNLAPISSVKVAPIDNKYKRT